MEFSCRELRAKKKWTRYLRALKVGTYKFRLETIQEYNALRVIANRLNKSPEEASHYDASISTKKKDNRVTLVVTRRENNGSGTSC